MPHAAQQIVLQESLDALSECTERVNRLTEQIQRLLPQWCMFPVAQALQTLRGVSLIVASTTIAELGDLTRFASPVVLMLYLGLVPSEHIKEFTSFFDHTKLRIETFPKCHN
jgi:transposase